jgi:hypothetical protein
MIAAHMRELVEPGPELRAVPRAVAEPFLDRRARWLAIAS